MILKADINVNKDKFELVIHMPLSAKCLDTQALAKEGIINYYHSFFNYKKKLNHIGTKRIIYYIISALLLLSLWNIVFIKVGENFISALLNAGGTVLLWEIMSMIFIERKNMKDRTMIKKKMLDMNILFEYY